MLALLVVVIVVVVAAAGGDLKMVEATLVHDWKSYHIALAL